MQGATARRDGGQGDVAALAGVELAGTVAELGLRARRVDNAASFDVRIALTVPPDVVLRAGYSAVAEVEVARVTDVLVLPERCLVHREGRTLVVVTHDPAMAARASRCVRSLDGRVQAG